MLLRSLTKFEKCFWATSRVDATLRFRPTLRFRLKEIAAITDTHERIELQMILDNVGMHVTADIKKTRERAVELVMLGFGIADAAHVAFAETSSAQFISCDDRLIKKCRDHNINVWCGNPVFFCDKEGLR